MIGLGVVLFALAISLHTLVARIVAEHLAKLASERDKRAAISRMWSRLPG